MADNAAKDATDLCGKKVGTTRSTSFPVEIEKWSKQNCEAGRQAGDSVRPGRELDRRPQPAQAGPHRRRSAGQRDAALCADAGARKYRVVGEPFAKGYQGIMFRKDDAALREVVTEKLTAMIADGAYKAVLDKWGLGANAVAQPMLNAAPQ